MGGRGINLSIWG